MDVADPHAGVDRVGARAIGVMFPCDPSCRRMVSWCAGHVDRVRRRTDARAAGLLGVPAGDRGRARPSRAQALRAARPRRHRGARADTRRRPRCRPRPTSTASSSTASPSPRSRGMSSAFVRWVAAMNSRHGRAGRRAAATGSSSTSSTPTTGSSPARRERVAARIERPWLVTIHATEYGRHQGWVQSHPQSHIHAAEREMVRGADHVITCSRYMRSHVANVFGVRPVEDHRDPERDRSARPRAGRRRSDGAARALRDAGRAARAAGRPARLREGLPPGTRRARADDPPARRGTLRRRRHRHRRGRAQAPGRRLGLRPRGVPGLGRRRHAALAVPRLPTCASCPRSTSRSASSRSRRWPPGACAWSPTPVACARSCRSTGRSACASPRATPPRCVACSSGS